MTQRPAAGGRDLIATQAAADERPRGSRSAFRGRERYVCVDAGTSVVKAVVYDADGTELTVARRRVPVSHPRPGWCEQDMAAVWRAVADAVREAAAGRGVDVVAVTGQGDGCWLVDGVGEPTGPAVLWNDARAAGVVESWRAAGVLDEALAVSGSLTFAGLPNALLTWLRAHDPERIARSASVLTCTGWLFSRLTEVIGIDVSEASNPFLAAESDEYSGRLLDLFGLDWARGLLPDVMAQRCAPLTPSAADQAGLAAGTPVVMAPYDVAATTIGVGVTGPGQVACVLGTTLSTSAFVHRVPGAGAGGGMTLHGVPPGPYLRVLPSLVGTEALDWCARLLGVADPGELSALAAAAAGDVATPVFLPYLSPAGERAPFLDPRAQGALSGLALGHGPEHVARAVFAGLTLAVVDCVTSLGAAGREIRVAGGGAASDLWCQLIADYCGAPVVRSADREAGAKGALLAAAVAVGAEPDVATAAARLVRAGRRMDPRGTPADLPAYERFRTLRRALVPTWRHPDSEGGGQEGVSGE